jgi:hypothetical protein
MSESKKTAWDMFSDHAVEATLIVVLIVLVLTLPWSLVIIVPGLLGWAAREWGEHRSKQ